MKMANDDKVSSRHLQLPLAFSKPDPGDLKRVSAFSGDRPASEPPVSLSKVFRRFSGPCDTLLQINRMIETISGLLEKVHARDDIRNMALVELQTIRKAIEAERPGGLISKQRKIAEEAFEKAQDIVFSRS